MPKGNTCSSRQDQQYFHISLASKMEDGRKTCKINSYWDEFIATHTPEDIAKQLLEDAERVDEGEMPSPLAMHLPAPSTAAALEIGDYLTPSPSLPVELRRFFYDKIRSRLQRSIEEIKNNQDVPLPDDGYLLAGDFATIVPPSHAYRRFRLPPDATEPTQADAENALKVLRYVGATAKHPSPEIDRAIHLVEQRFNIHVDEMQPSLEDITAVESWDKEVSKYHALRPPTRQNVCYHCQFLLIDPHPLYKHMCRACGAFNLAGSALSLPHSLQIPGMTALVTGARINLGYLTALRLLRCGAYVIASTRYPNDAAIGYTQEHDFEDWKGRLKIVGADFRRARDAFALAEATKSIIQSWGATTLDILINNAAQTLTDSVKKEERAVLYEQQQLEQAAATHLIFHTPQQTRYQPLVRAGISPLSLYGGEISPPSSSSSNLPLTLPPSEPITLPTNVKDDGRTELQPYFKSSWVQTLSEIPYEDIVSTHAINAFVPLLLCRELLPIMGVPRAPSSSSTPPASGSSNKPRKPRAYIVNVSAREGMFENAPHHARKNGTHVHTNMAKAALNMITQTEAAAAWRERSVAMNTVDPGYLSAAPEMDGLYDGRRPLSWEDGAGRVLWSVAVGEVEGRAVWGRFLRHYGAEEVDSVALNK
ncbi:hypothetical protein B0T22DRAFT_162461 [Podospora appendiculata]|uniref:Oxidoreductase n=1 Tax=Podospora appendiculata TaxID=314037 RepID=A0AAE0XA03_9PEZI|nr:hypothetical protein B0T22DRAFT_162461 [Podospora appendiculata]